MLVNPNVPLLVGPAILNLLFYITFSYFFDVYTKDKY